MGVTTVSDNTDLNIQKSPEKGVNTKIKKGVVKETKILITSVALAILVALKPGAATAKELPKDIMGGFSLTQKDLDSIEEIHASNVTFISMMPGLTDETRKGLIQMSEQNRMKIANGEMPAKYPLKIQISEGIASSQDLDFIVNDGSLIEIGQTFEKITGLKVLNHFKKWEQTVTKLFETEGRGKWLRTGEERRELTPEELEADKTAMEKVKERWLVKLGVWKGQLAKLDTKEGVKEGTHLTECFKKGCILFYKAIKDTPYPSREIFRRLFVDSFSIAYFITIGETNDELPTNIAEYVALTQKGVKMMKIQFGELKYLFIDGEYVVGISGLEQYEHIFDDFFARYIARFDEKQELVKVTAEGEQLDKEIARSEKDLAAAEAKRLQSEKESALSKKGLELTTEVNSLSREVLGLITSYNNSSDRVVYDKIVEKIARIKEIKGELEEIVEVRTDEKGKKITDEFVEMMAETIKTLEGKLKKISV